MPSSARKKKRCARASRHRTSDITRKETRFTFSTRIMSDVPCSILQSCRSCLLTFFFFNDTATTEIYTLSYTTLFRSCSLPRHFILACRAKLSCLFWKFILTAMMLSESSQKLDRKSTRLNSSHSQISYAVFCSKKKKVRACEPTSHVGYHSEGNTIYFQYSYHVRCTLLHSSVLPLMPSHFFFF